MRLLQRIGTSGCCRLTEPFISDQEIPPYAILSHTWGAELDEVTFDDLNNGTGIDKPGYEKVQFCLEQARRDGLDYFWIDTCCIKKEDKAELSKAVNSMFRWYRNADQCYVYLSDVSTVNPKENSDTCEWEPAFRRSRWFTRGWTLQELLAPISVKFFSRQCQQLGDKDTLRSQIHAITAIPMRALQGERLSHFSVNDRLSWMVDRQTKREEDKVYSLLGIFGVSLPRFYDEGFSRALARLQDEIKKLEECTRDLHITDPRLDKARIEETKGGLIEGLCHWVFQKEDFLYWRDDPQSRVLWVKGDPGKGKTMLLCSAINELSNSTATTAYICYFFCQATDSRINSATAVLRGLLFMLVSQEPSLISHMREKYDKTGRALFEDANAWLALREIFQHILNDPNFGRAYIFIDALDECVHGLDKLLAFIVESLSPSSSVKWILTSRNYTNIEQRLRLEESGTRLSLELKENATQISYAVNSYIKHCLTELEQIQHDRSLQLLVQDRMQEKANDTFLWVSLVMRELRDVPAWEVMQVLEEIPTDLIDVYRRMMEHVNQLKRRNPELCRRCLSTVIATYRPLHLQELHALVDLPKQGTNVEETTEMFVKMCGSFLTIRENYVYVIHQSARDFLSEDTSLSTYLSGAEVVHKQIFYRSLQAMTDILQRDMYRLKALGSLIEHVQTPEPDPLVALRYSCVYWIDHLYEWNLGSSLNGSNVLQSGGPIDSFLRKKYIYWLEALSLCKGMSKGVRSMARLDALINKAMAVSLTEIVQDARRFIMSNRSTVESSPLQVYASALLFSPSHSFIRILFQEEELKGIVIRSRTFEEWSSCLLTLEGHGYHGSWLTFSHDSTRLALATSDHRIKVWDTSCGELVLTLEDWTGFIKSIAFSRQNQLLSAAKNGIVKVWDTGTKSSDCLLALNGHIKTAAFSYDSNRLVTGSKDGTIEVWDAYSTQCLLKCKGHGRGIYSVAFSHDSARLASGSQDRTIKVWDALSSQCLLTLKGHGDMIATVVFSHDSTKLASGSWDGTIRVWDIHNGKCISKLEGHVNTVNCVAFSHNSSWLASGSVDCTIQIWDVHSGKRLSTLKGHRSSICSIAFSHDSTQLASVSKDTAVKLWDVQSALAKRNSDLFEENSNLDEGHRDDIESLAFSQDSTRLASASRDNTVKVWDTHSGKCLVTLKGHSGNVTFVKFLSPNRLASSSMDSTVRIWNIISRECILTLHGHRLGVHSLDFSCDRNKHVRLASTSYDGTVKVWDISSGKCLSTIKVEQSLHDISFEPSDKYLHTDIGIADFSTVPIFDSTLTSIEPQTTQSQCVGLSADKAWITYKSEKLLILPPDYRPNCSAVSGNIIAIGACDRKVRIYEVQGDIS